MKIESQSCKMSRGNKEILRRTSEEYGIPMTTLLGIALDKEIHSDQPFAYNLVLPEGEMEEYAYVEEATKILDYMKVNAVKGMPLALLALIRKDMRVPDLEQFLSGFKECLNRELVEAFAAPIDGMFKYPNGTILYKPIVSTKEISEAKRKFKKASKYETYQKLKREFGDE